MKMLVPIVTLLGALISVALASPVQHAEQKSTLTDKVKRSAEVVMFGNHQNAPRVKKSDQSVEDMTRVDNEEVHRNEIVSNSNTSTPDNIEGKDVNIDSNNTSDENSNLLEDLMSYSEDEEQAKEAEEDKMNHQTAEEGRMENVLDENENEIREEEPQQVDPIVDKGYFPYFSPYRRKRQVALTAEDMVMGGERKSVAGSARQRVKRDLIGDYDLDELMSEEQGDANGVAAPDSDENEIPTENDLEREEKKLLLLNYISQHPDILDYISEYDERTLDEDEDGADDGNSLDEESGLEYIPLIHNGRRGIFVPFKRQYMSLVPGVRKRSSRSRHWNEPASPRQPSPERYYAELIEDIERAREAEEVAKEKAYDDLYRLAAALASN